jgi:hypothetical protein
MCAKRPRASLTADPLAELREGWDLLVAFGLKNPGAYALICSEPERGGCIEAREGLTMLHALVARVAEAGQLRVSVPQAVQLISAGARGVTLSLISEPPEARDAQLSETMRETMLAAITAAPSGRAMRGQARVAARTVALRAVLEEVERRAVVRGTGGSTD